MAGQGKFAFCGEDAKARQRAIAGGFLHEYRLGQIHLSRDGLHLARRKAIAIRDHGERIAGERLIREDVQLVKMPLHFWLTRP